MRKFRIIFLLVSFTSSIAFSQQSSGKLQSSTEYDQHKVFTPLFYSGQINEYRSASGVPGPKYWQNRADYKLDVTLDTVMHFISGTVIITYTNNSPDKMTFLWLQLDQNAFCSDSRAVATSLTDEDLSYIKPFTKGYELKDISIIKNGRTEKTAFLVSDTRLQIKLKDTLGSGGEKIQIKITYGFEISEKGLTRTGRVNTKNGWVYTIAQWYPRMAVYDDVTGWNLLPYLTIGEFYLEYGDFEYSITAPANLILVGSGELLNPSEVLSAAAIKRLNDAKISDQTIFIVDSSEVNQSNTRSNNKNLTWRFSCENSRDVAWAASKAFIWDAARINLPSGKKALAQSVYPVESLGKDAGSRSTEYAKASIESFSKKWNEYSYPIATNVACSSGDGMEYPGIVFIESGYKGFNLWHIENHEFGHHWFPIVVGSNERKYAWMDEGFNDFIDWISTKEFNNGEYTSSLNQWLNKKVSLMFPDSAEVIMNFPDVFQENFYVNASYDKPAFGLTILREQILGEERFDFAFRTYMQRWAYRHPTPWDFFHSMDNAAGEDLSWFWNEWFFTDWKLDQSVKEIEYVDNDSSRGARITIENLGGLALPVTLLVKEDNGKTGIVNLPVEIWQRGGKWTFTYQSTSKINSVTVDPDHVLPDINRENNFLRGLK